VIRGAEATSYSATAASRILGNLRKSFQIEAQQIQTGASIGISVFPADGVTSDALMKNADIAMYNAKSHGRNTHRFFSKEMQAEVLERVAVENDLRMALGDHSFKLMYQPQIEIATGRVTGFEALLRWLNPNRQEIPTNRIIQIAEESNLILSIGSWVMNEACRQLQRWRVQGYDSIRMAVNVSMMQLQDERFFQALKRVLRAHGLSGSDIELEITESAIMENIGHVQKVLLSLRDLGVGLAIDDFGTGYSSLSRLNLLPIQRLKIERSFVRDIDRNASSVKICGSIIVLAHSLGMKTVAEGVETKAQKIHLKQLKCDEIQGYLIAKPLPAESVMDFIAQHNAECLAETNRNLNLTAKAS
jgi:predicted signal transduction protein with EAL and GGDEF domain